MGPYKPGSKRGAKDAIIALRGENEPTLQIPGLKIPKKAIEVALSLPGDQPEKVREFFEYYFVKRSPKDGKKWDCFRFAGFVALNTPLDVPTTWYCKSEYARKTIIRPYELEAGLPYDIFAYSEPVHSTIGLGSELNIGVTGLGMPIRVTTNRKLINKYYGQMYAVVTSRESIP